MKPTTAKDMTPFARWMNSCGLDTDQAASEALGLGPDQVRNLRKGTRRGADARAATPDRRTRLAMAAVKAGLKPYG